MKNEGKSGAQSRKVLAASLAVIMAFVMLLSGTLAYFYQSRAVNTITGAEQKKVVIGHDDFVQVRQLPDGDIEYNKDVYVENVGDTPVFVRVKLSEELMIGEKKITAVHIPETAENLGVGTVPSDTDAASEIHSYFTLNFGTAGDRSRVRFLSAEAKAYTDGSVTGVETVQGVAKDNSNTMYDPADKSNLDIAQNLEILKYAEVITMKEFMDENKTDEWRQRHDACWVIDNSPEQDVTFTDDEGRAVTKKVSGGGWAYWSKMLNPQESTGVLLNSVIVDAKLAGSDYTYNINVDFESVDKTDQNVWLTGQSTANDGKTTDITTDLASKDARTLLTYAGDEALGAYSQETLNKITEIKTAKEEATSPVAQNIYDTAIAKLNEFVQSDQKYGFSVATMYAEMAKETEAMKKSNDETLDDPVIVVRETGEVVDSPLGMQEVIAKAIMENADFDGDGTLTVEEALGLTDFFIRDENVTSLEGLNLTNFPHLRSLNVGNCTLQTFDANSFVKTENGKTTGLERLSLCNLTITPTSLDLTPLASTVKRAELYMISGVKEVTGLNGWNNMNFFDEWRNSFPLKRSTLNQIIESSEETLRSLHISGTLVGDDGKPLAELNDLGITFPSSVMNLSIGIDNMKGVYYIQNLSELRFLKMYNYANTKGMKAEVTNCPALCMAKAYNGIAVTGADGTALPNGVVATWP